MDFLGQEVIRGKTPRGLTDEERFWISIKRGGINDCWESSRCKNKLGYSQIPVNIHGRMVNIMLHRFSYIIHFGDIPPGMMVDHVCHNPSCVNPNHLRLASPSQNTMNSCIRSDNVSRFKGVTKRPGRNKWRARIRLNGKLSSLGDYDSPEEAYEAYVKAANEFFREYAYHDGPKAP